MVDERKNGNGVMNKVTIFGLAAIVIALATIGKPFVTFTALSKDVQANEIAVSSVRTDLNEHIKEDNTYKQIIAGRLGGIEASLNAQTQSTQAIQKMLEDRFNTDHRGNNR